MNNLEYFEPYAPVASWSTIQTEMNIAAQCGWDTWRVDFSNAFVQGTIKE